MSVKRNKKKDLAAMEHFKDVFERCNGFMSIACREAEMSAFEVQELRDIYPRFDNDLNEYANHRTELVANEMFKLAYHGREKRIKSGGGGVERVMVQDTDAMKFWLKTQGAHMGFVERKAIEVEIQDKRAKITSDQISDDPIEASRQYQELIS